MAQQYGAISVQKKGFGHAVNAQRHTAGTVAVHTNGNKRIAILLKKVAGVGRLVLIGDAQNTDIFFQQGQCRCLGAARGAPAGKNIDQQGRTCELGRAHITRCSIKAGQHNIGNGFADHR